MAQSTTSEKSAEAIDIQPVAIESALGNGERRRSARYDCVGVAEILHIPEAAGEFVTGKIRNLSLLGCYIDTQSALEQGSQLAVVLQVNTFKIRVIAEIRSVKLNGRFSAGLEFIGMEAPELQSLQELIAELKQKASSKIQS
jgi:hypothetical protein